MSEIPSGYKGFFEHIWAEARKQGFSPIKSEWPVPMVGGKVQIAVRSPSSRTGAKVVVIKVPPYKRN